RGGGRVPPDSGTRGGGAGGLLAPRRGPVAARDDDPASGAPCSRVDLRFFEARTRLSAHHRPFPQRPATARPPRLPPPPARRGRARLRAHAVRRSAARGAPAVTPEELDGRVGEGWGGTSPNGSHVNVVLAPRGSPTPAAPVSL